MVKVKVKYHPKTNKNRFFTDIKIQNLREAEKPNLKAEIMELVDPCT